MVDTLLTYALVLVAAGFVIWRVVLPARARKYLGGQSADCSTSGDCSSGCGGCPSAKKAR